MTPRRLLVVDDDKDFADSLGELLEQRGHSVVVAYSGPAAIEILDDQHFDLALLDVRMPGMTGIDSFFEMKRHRPDMRVMMMTAYGAADQLDEVLAGGAVGVLDKPISPAEVLAIVERVKPRAMVLVVDDDVDSASSMNGLLTGAGHAVIVAHTGEEALDRMDAEEIAVLVLDLRLPTMSGLDVYMELKRFDRLVPTVVVTAYAGEEAGSLSALRDLGVMGVLTKPFSPDTFLDVVADAVADSS